MRRLGVAATCLLFAGLASFLLAAGVPRLLAAVVLLPGDPPLADIEDGKASDEASLKVIIDSRLDALRFAADPRIYTDIALAKILLADQSPSGNPEREVLMGQAIDQLRLGLAGAPANSFAWARLAYALRQRPTPGMSELDAWRLSIATAPADPKLVAWRAWFGFQMAGQLTDPDRALLAKQVGYARRYHAAAPK